MIVRKFFFPISLSMIVLFLLVVCCNSAAKKIIEPGLYHRAKDANANLIRIKDHNRFTMQVNICFGWGVITGKWAISQGNLILTEEKRDFEGFQPGAPKEFKFRILSDQTFIYQGEARFCFNADGIDEPDGIFTIINTSGAKAKIRREVFK